MYGVSCLSKAWPARRFGQLKLFAKVILTVSVILAVVMYQPDLGTAIVLTVISGALVIFSGLPRWLLVSTLVGLSLLLPMSRFVLADYQLRRLESFSDPYGDPRGSGYQVIQSTIAVGSGMFLGRGLGRGTQSQLKFLPERHTDFIFASIVEELGAVGGLLVLLLYVSIFVGLLVQAYRLTSREEWLLVTSVTTWLFFQAAVNILMNLGLAPVTGITLPFLSAGGSSLVSSAVMLGLVVSVGKKLR